MKQILLSICCCLLFSISCSSNETKVENEINMKSSVLNERWSNNESFNLSFVSIPESTPEWYNQMHNGTDCSFYENNTFEICIWWYGVSSGLHRSIIGGSYLYNADIGSIELLVDESLVQSITYSSNGKSYPTIYYMMEGLRIKNRIHLDYIQEDKIPILSNPKMKILDEENDTIKIALSAVNEKGDMISFGEQSYIREKLDENKRLLNN